MEVQLYACLFYKCLHGLYYADFNYGHRFFSDIHKILCEKAWTGLAEQSRHFLSKTTSASG